MSSRPLGALAPAGRWITATIGGVLPPLPKSRVISAFVS